MYDLFVFYIHKINKLKHLKGHKMIDLNKNKNGGMVVVTADAGAGSSGKGCLNSWLADSYDFHIATNNWASNAGHFTELDRGTRILVQHIPSAFVNKSTELYINAGASIDIDILLKEIDMLEGLGFPIKNRLSIHPHANIITNEDKETEKKLIKSGSTFKGCGAALAGKTLRAGRKLAKDYAELTEVARIKDMTYILNMEVSLGMRVLIEGSQGIDLDINHAEFPYCTSRQTTPAQLVADAGIAMEAITNTILNVRTNPIRINNESAAKPGEMCYSGNYWGAKEITWQDIAKQSGYDSYENFLYDYEFALMTSVTKKVRRVFEFPTDRMKYIHALCGGLLPNNNLLYSLNFVNFIDRNVRGKTESSEILTPKVNDWLEKYFYPAVGRGNLKWIRTGPRHSEIAEIPMLIKF